MSLEIKYLWNHKIKLSIESECFIQILFHKTLHLYWPVATFAPILIRHRKQRCGTCTVVLRVVTIHCQTANSIQPAGKTGLLPSLSNVIHIQLSNVSTGQL